VSRPILLIGLGLAAGYAYGFRDARTHDQTILRRTADAVLARAGGSARGRYTPDVDAEAERATGAAGAADGGPAAARAAARR
jgi:hypothetical protein